MKSEMLCPIAPIGSNVQLGLRANSLEAYPLQDATYMIHHGNTYEIGIKNNNSISVSAQIQIDGKTVGTFVIKPYGMSWIERPVNEQRKFTFYRLDSREANDAKLDKVSHSDLGLIKVIVKHEQHPHDLRFIFTIMQRHVPQGALDYLTHLISISSQFHFTDRIHRMNLIYVSW